MAGTWYRSLDRLQIVWTLRDMFGRVPRTMDALYFSELPTVVLATNTFVDVPIILQYEDTPLIQFIKEQSAGFTTEIPIYHPDGTYLAKARGSQLYLTDDGKKAGLTLVHAGNVTVCKLGSQVLFEIKRSQAAALRTRAELYAPNGYFLKCTDVDVPKLFDASGQELRIGGVTMRECTFTGCRIGIHVGRQSIAIGVS